MTDTVVVVNKPVSVVEVVEEVSEIVSPQTKFEQVIVQTGPPGRQGPSGPPGRDGGSFRTNMQVVPEPNGTNKVFTTPSEYDSATLIVFLNGIVEFYATSHSGNQIVFEDAPQVDDEIRVCYNEVYLDGGNTL